MIFPGSFRRLLATAVSVNYDFRSIFGKIGVDSRRIRRSRPDAVFVSEAGSHPAGAFPFGIVRLEWFNVSIDKSLKRKSRLARVRSVLSRAERIDQMKANEKWVEGSSPFGIPKTRVIRLVLGKKKKKKAAEGEEGAADKKKAAKKK